MSDCCKEVLTLLDKCKNRLFSANFVSFQWSYLRSVRRLVRFIWNFDDAKIIFWSFQTTQKIRSLKKKRFWMWSPSFFLGHNGKLSENNVNPDSAIKVWYVSIRPSYKKCLFFSLRQCRCIFRDQLHLARLEDLLQRLLKCAIDRICELRVPAVEDGKKAENIADDNEKSSGDVDLDIWSEVDKERLFLAVGKIFQLPFPFYQVRKIHLLRQVWGICRNKLLAILVTIFNITKLVYFWSCVCRATARYVTSIAFPWFII